MGPPAPMFPILYMYILWCLDRSTSVCLRYYSSNVLEEIVVYKLSIDNLQMCVRSPWLHISRNEITGLLVQQLLKLVTDPGDIQGVYYMASTMYFEVVTTIDMHMYMNPHPYYNYDNIASSILAKCRFWLSQVFNLHVHDIIHVHAFFDTQCTMDAIIVYFWHNSLLYSVGLGSQIALYCTIV